MTKYILLALISVIIMATGCELSDQNNDTPCEPKMCTLEFASITVKFTDKAGNPVAVKDFKSINTRTNLSVKYAGPYTVLGTNTYTVANDSDLKEFSDTGDEVLVSGTHPTTGQLKTATFNVSGGCACHIRKIAGLNEIVFD
jgi:hypothetical protein